MFWIIRRRWFGQAGFDIATLSTVALQPVFLIKKLRLTNCSIKLPLFFFNENFNFPQFDRDECVGRYIQVIW